MTGIILIVHVLACFMIIALVLLQQGKGAEMGAGFGSGSANTVFGSQGATPFLMKLTLTLGALFFITSLTLNYLTSAHVKSARARAVSVVPAQQNVPVNANVPAMPAQSKKSA